MYLYYVFTCIYVYVIIYYLRDGRIEELVGGQNPGSEAPPRIRKGQERREQMRCQERSDCRWSVVEGWVCQGH